MARLRDVQGTYADDDARVYVTLRTTPVNGSCPRQNWMVFTVRTDEMSLGSPIPVRDGQLTPGNLTIEPANGAQYAYRRFGKTGLASPPLVFLQQFRGSLDKGDPSLVDEVTVECEVRHRNVNDFVNSGVGKRMSVPDSPAGSSAVRPSKSERASSPVTM